MSEEHVEEQWGVTLIDQTVVICILTLPGLLAVEQTKSALRGRRNSCRVMEPLEADMLAGSGATGAFFWPVGSPFRRSSSAFNASLLSAKKKRNSSFETTMGIRHILHIGALKSICFSGIVLFVQGRCL